MEKLPKEQQLFVQRYLQTGNATESVRQAQIKTKNPTSYGYYLLQQDRIRREIQRIESMEREEIKRQFRAGSKEALEVLMSIVRDEEGNPQHRVAAAKDILSRGGFDATAKHDTIEDVTEHETIESLRTKLLIAFHANDGQAGTGTIDSTAIPE